MSQGDIFAALQTGVKFDKKRFGGDLNLFGIGSRPRDAEAGNGMQSEASGSSRRDGRCSSNVVAKVKKRKQDKGLALDNRDENVSTHFEHFVLQAQPSDASSPACSSAQLLSPSLGSGDPNMSGGGTVRVQPSAKGPGSGRSRRGHFASQVQGWSHKGPHGGVSLLYPCYCLSSMTCRYYRPPPSCPQVHFMSLYAGSQRPKEAAPHSSDRICHPRPSQGESDATLNRLPTLA